MKKIQDTDVKSKVVLVREDYNVPLMGGRVADDFRIRASLPTLQYLKEHGARTLILSHLGRPDGEVKKELSLRPVAEHLSKLVGEEVLFFESYAKAQKGVSGMKNGQIALYENIRFNPGEEGADEKFTKKLASLGSIYVNDAFGVSHRRHASVYVLPQLLPAYAGLILQKEVATFDRLREGAARPITYIMGGAKVETKIRVVEKLINNIDAVCFGGLLANSILAAKGLSIGKSLYEKDIEKYIDNFELTDNAVHLPVDVVVAKDFEGRTPSRVTAVGDIREDEIILDIGHDTIKLFSDIIKNSKTVFWNGPMGLFEVAQYAKGTYALAEALKETTAEVIIGGGEITRAVYEVGAVDAVSYISTGGGAMLEYLAEGTLPGIEVLEK